MSNFKFVFFSPAISSSKFLVFWFSIIQHFQVDPEPHICTRAARVHGSAKYVVQWSGVACVPELLCSGWYWRSKVALRFDLGNRLCSLEVHPHNDETTDAVSLHLCMNSGVPEKRLRRDRCGEQHARCRQCFETRTQLTTQRSARTVHIMSTKR